MPLSNSAQKRALRNYRARIAERGMARFEVLALDTDRDLIRSLASRLAEGGPEARCIRASIGEAIGAESQRRGGILEALRRSPLIGANLEVDRPEGRRRKVDL